jgi:hypothetical protein
MLCSLKTRNGFGVQGEEWVALQQIEFNTKPLSAMPFGARSIILGAADANREFKLHVDHDAHVIKML